MQFAKKLLAWYHQHGRHDLPWQRNPTPYRVWISEIMLQQTQVSTVIPYYQRFMKRFPSLKALAEADTDSVLSHWSGLGYYARARNLHKAAKIICEHYKGRFPKSVEALATLPGIGESTAGAIASFSMQIPAAILDGNVKRVLTRFYAIEGWPGKSEVNRQLWQIAHDNTPEEKTHHYNQAMMDLGATICTRTKPKCDLCPLSRNCEAHAQGREVEFPTRKASQEKPIRQIHSLLLRRPDGSLLFERRPPTGIWGGLWSFPECPLDDDLEKLCHSAFQCKITSTETWESFTHKFSHFSLEIHPVLVNINHISSIAMDSDDKLWYKLGNSLPGGIAKPVMLLLKKYEEVYEPYDFL